MFLLGFTAAFALAMYDIIRHGTEFVDVPRLGSASELIKPKTARTTGLLGSNGEAVELKASKEA
jgi:hypothetical protein